MLLLRQKVSRVSPEVPRKVVCCRLLGLCFLPSCCASRVLTFIQQLQVLYNHQEATLHTQ